MTVCSRSFRVFDTVRTHRLALMNMRLHGIEGGIQFGDTLSKEGTHLPAATLSLSNPPFGTKKGGELVPQDPNDEPASALMARIASSNTTLAWKNRRKLSLARKELAQTAINL